MIWLLPLQIVVSCNSTAFQMLTTLWIPLDVFFNVRCKFYNEIENENKIVKCILESQASRMIHSLIYDANKITTLSNRLKSWDETEHNHNNSNSYKHNDWKTLCGMRRTDNRKTVFLIHMKCQTNMRTANGQSNASKMLLQDWVEFEVVSLNDDAIDNVFCENY